MQKHRNQEIEQQSKKWLHAALPTAAWEVYDLSPDIAKDQQVELVEKGEYLGLTFLVQLKGQERVRLSRDGRIVKFQIETKYLFYYEKINLPVYLVLFDVSTKVGYWCFLQHYIREDMDDGNWRSRHSVTLNLPAKQTLDKQDSFRVSVYAAVGYVAAIHAQPLKLAVQAEQERLQQIDPRFLVECTATSSGTQYQLNPKRPVDINFTFTGGQDLSARIEQLIDCGREVAFKPGEVTTRGTPLLEGKFGLEQGVKIKFGINRTGTLVVRAHGRPDCTICSLPLLLEGGMKELRFLAGRAGGPISIAAITNGSGRTIEFTFTFRPAAWFGLSLRHLSMYTEAISLAEAVAGRAKLVLEFHVHGLRQWTAEADCGLIDDGDCRSAVEAMLFVAKANRVATFFGVDRLVPRQPSLDDYDDIEALAALVADGICEYETSNRAIEFSTDAEGAKGFLAAGKEGRINRICLQPVKFVFAFFGEPLELSLGYECTELVEVGTPSVESQIIEGHTDIRVKLKGGEGSKTILRMLDQAR